MPFHEDNMSAVLDLHVLQAEEFRKGRVVDIQVFLKTIRQIVLLSCMAIEIKVILSNCNWSY